MEDSSDDDDQNVKQSNLSIQITTSYDRETSSSNVKNLSTFKTSISQHYCKNEDQNKEIKLLNVFQDRRERNDKLNILTHNNFSSITTHLEPTSDDWSKLGLVIRELDCNLNSATKDNKTFNEKYAVEFLQNSANADVQICSDTNLKGDSRSNLKKVAKKSNIKTTKFSKAVKKIMTRSKKCIEANLKSIEVVESLISKSDPVSSLIIKNLVLQQNEFEKFVEDTVNSIENDTAEDNLKWFDLQSKNECKLFLGNYPSYGYKSRILNYVKESQVLVISSDCSYFFNVVIPIIIQKSFPTHSIFFCESHCLASEYVKIKIEDMFGKNPETFPNISYIIHNKLLNMLSSCKTLDTFVIVINVPLNRSINLDLSLAFLRDLLHKQENSRLILLTSIFDNFENYKKYFSKLKLRFFDVPSLLLPIKTVWKKNPSNNIKLDLVKTAFSIHILNSDGNILAFLPNESEAKHALDLFNTKLQELELNNIEAKYIKGVLLDENSDVSYLTSEGTPEKRFIFFTTHFSESVPMKSVHHIIDCGLKQNSMYDTQQNNSERLAIEFCSRAKAKLRKSLVRVFVPGICYRIYSKENWSKNMPPFEHPDILTNPFNSLIKIFLHAPENALSIELIEPLDKAVKYKTVEQLKSFKAIENGKLTALGKTILKLPFPVKYSKMILTGIDLSCSYETVILVAYFSTDFSTFNYSEGEENKRVINSDKLLLLQHESDVLSFLNIFKAWIQNESSKAWCDKLHINWNTLHEIEKKVSEICQNVYKCIKVSIQPKFNESDELIPNLKKMLLQNFTENLCVFSGHYKNGYRILSTSQTAFIHPSSMFFNNKNLPQFILFNKIINSNLLVDITAFSLDFVLVSETNGNNKILDYDFSDILEKKLARQKIEPVGKKLMEQVLLGDNEKKLQEIEESIKKLLGTDSIIIEPCVENFCVYVYALELYLNKAVNEVDEILKSNLDMIINAEHVRILELKRGNVVVPIEIRFAMGAKIVSIKIKNTSVEFYSDQRIRESHKNCMLNTYSYVQCCVNLTWVRRPCNTKCYIIFSPDDFERAQMLLTKFRSLFSNSGSSQVCPDEDDIFCDSNDFEIHQYISKDLLNILENFVICPERDYTLLCCSLSPKTDPKVIEKQLEKYLPNIKVDVEIIAFEKYSFESSETDTENIKMKIEKIINEFEILSMYEIEVPKPIDSDTIWTACVNVFCTENLTTIAKKLSNSLIDGYSIHAEPVYKTITITSHKLFKVVESQLKNVINELRQKTIKTFKFNPEEFIDKNVTRIELSSNCISTMNQLQRVVSDFLEGEILNKKSVSDIEILFYGSGYLFLQELQLQKNVYILVENSSKSIRLYGGKDEREEAKKCILNFLEDTVSDAKETLGLDHGNDNRTLLKAIIKTYGMNLNILLEQVSELRSVVLDLKENQLLLCGSRKSIAKVKELLDKLSSSIDSTLPEGGETCPVCGKNTLNLTFRLLHCDHLYCKECIVNLVTRAKFPIQCCAKNCSKVIVLDDIMQILNKDDNLIKQLLQASLDNYLEQNKTDIIYCPVPDCTMFLKVIKNNVTPRLKCPLCLNEICVKCNVIFHFGYTCDVFQSCRRVVDNSTNKQPLSLRPKDVDFDAIWADLKKTVEDVITLHHIDHNIWNKQFSDIYALCVDISGSLWQKLYLVTRDYLENHVRKLLMFVIFSSDGVLVAYYNFWIQYSQGVNNLNKLYTYLNTYHIKKQRLNKLMLKLGDEAALSEQKLEIEELGLEIWKTHMIQELKDNLVQLLLEGIRNDRKGDSSNQSIFHGVILSFVLVDVYKKDDPLELYINMFEKPLLQDIGEYYTAESQRLLQENDCSQYMEKVLQRLEEEKFLSQKYLHPSSYPKVIEVFEQRMVGDHKVCLREECQRIIQQKNDKAIQNMTLFLETIPSGANALISEHNTRIRGTQF